MNKKIRRILLSLIVLAVLAVVPSIKADSGDTSLFQAIKSEITKSGGSLLRDSASMVNIPQDYSFNFGTVTNPAATITTGATSVSSSLADKWAQTHDRGKNNQTWRTIFASDYVTPTTAPSGNKNLSYSVCFPNFNTYHGKWIDVRGSIVDYRVNSNIGGDYPGTAVMAITWGPAELGARPSVESEGLDWIRVVWQFTESNGSCTGAPISVKGNTTYWDVDHQQGIMMYDSTNVGFYINSSGNKLRNSNATWTNSSGTAHSHKYIFSVRNEDADIGDPNNAFTEIFDTGNGNTINRVYTYYRPDSTGAKGGMQHSSVAVNKVDEVPPTKSVDIDYVDYRSNFTYRVRQEVPTQHPNYYYSSFFIQDTLDPCHDMNKTTADNVKVLNITQGAADVTGLFNITVEGTTVRATAKPETLASAGFYGQLYELVIPAGVQLGTTYSDSDGRYNYGSYAKDEVGYYIVKNQPVTYINNSPLTGNEVQIKVAPAPEKRYAGTSYADNKGWDHHEVLMPDARQKRDGDDIKYKITIAGVNSDEVITITDVLSKGLTYNGDATVSGGTMVSTTDPLVNSETKTTSLMWQIKVPKGTIATFTYSAKVNEDAVNLVNNDAKVKYGNSDAINVGTLSNPVPKKAYDSETANGMNGKVIQNGDVITYNIAYANGFKEKANINLKDTLSKDLKYKEKTAKICDGNKENCKTLEEAGVTETITANEDGTTTILWNDKNVESLQAKTIVYEVEAQGDETRVQNNFDIQICKASVEVCNNPYTDIDELKNPKPKKEYAPEPNAGFGHRAVAERSRIKYQITYENVEEDPVTVTITDTLSKGIEYVRGTFKVDGQKISDPAYSNNNKTFTLKRELEKDKKEVLTYEVLVTGETTKVNNKATAEYSNNPGYVRELAKLENPVPQKTYANNTKAGKNGATVKKGDVITYSIKFSNAKKEASSVIIMDNLSKGIEYIAGSAKVNGKKLEPVSATKDANGQMLVWMKEIAAGAEEELTYDVKVNGEKLLVENNATIQYDNDPVIKLDELRNPLVQNPSLVNIPNTASVITVTGIVLGISLIGGGSYLIYRRYKKA